jgi:hypothetical protein
MTELVIWLLRVQDPLPHPDGATTSKRRSTVTGAVDKAVLCVID